MEGILMIAFAVLGTLAGLAGGRLCGNILAALGNEDGKDNQDPPWFKSMGGFFGCIIGFAGMITVAAKYGVWGALIGLVLAVPGSALIYALLLLVSALLVYAGMKVVSLVDWCVAKLISSQRRHRNSNDAHD